MVSSLYAIHIYMRAIKNELYVEVQNIGFCFGVNAKMMHNYIHPAYLSFFNIAAAPCLNKINDEIVSADGIIHFENIELMNFSKMFHYCGKQLALCHDNKLRVCRVYRITFECEGRLQTMPFVVDKCLTTSGLLGKVAIAFLKNDYLSRMKPT